MSSKNGGPAFPRPAHTNYVGAMRNEAQDGMTLRDYFAAKVLPIMITDGAALEAIKLMTKKTGADAFELTAKACYAYADAMLEERNK